MRYIILLLILIAPIAAADTTSTVYGGTASTTADGGGAGGDWTNPSNATGSDAGTAATVTVDGDAGPGTSYRLDITNYDLSAIPDGSTIDSITATIRRRSAGDGTVRAAKIQLIVAGSTFSTNKATSASWGSTAVNDPFTWSSGGGDTMPTAAQVKASTFGVCVQVSELDDMPRTAYVYYISVAVTYTAPAGGSGGTGNFFLFF